MINIILGFLIGLCVGLVSLLIRYHMKIVEIYDDLPAENRNESSSYAMKLSNELKDYFYEKDGKICIKVVKKK